MHKSLIVALFIGASHGYLYGQRHKANYHWLNYTDWEKQMKEHKKEEPQHRRWDEIFHHNSQKSQKTQEKAKEQDIQHHKWNWDSIFTTTHSWNIPNPLKELKQYAKWGRIEWVDDDGNAIDAEAALYSTKSTNESNQWLRWYEEKTAKYIAYEAAARKFMLEDDYESKGKCPIMSFLTSESQIDAKVNQPYDPESIFYVEEPEEPNGVPVAMFHGFGDFCMDPGNIQFNEMLRRGTGAEVKCIEVGIPMVGSIIGNFEEIAKQSCQKLANDKTFHGEFNVVGLSQGGLLARYIAEECDMPGKVRNIVTLGGPHMGITSVPHCIKGVACDIVNMLAKKFLYSQFAQNWLAPAGYFRDVNDYQAYVKESAFLPTLNNELQTSSDYAKLRENKFSKINAGLFTMFTKDTVIYPKETAWFQGFDKTGKVQPLEESEFYQQDYIGLKSLNQAGKIQFDEIDGDHLHITTSYIKETVVPFLKK